MELRSRKEKEQEKMATLTEERSEELEESSTPGLLEEEMTDARVRMQSGRARSEESHRRQDEMEDGRGDVPSARVTSPLLEKPAGSRTTADEFERRLGESDEWRGRRSTPTLPLYTEMGRRNITGGSPASRPREEEKKERQDGEGDVHSARVTDPLLEKLAGFRTTTDDFEQRPSEFDEWRRRRTTLTMPCFTEPGRRDFFGRSPATRPGEEEKKRTSAFTPLKAKEYDGSQPWRNYRSHFERVSEINGWLPHRLQYLWAHLSGVALEYADGLPEKEITDYESLCDAMDSRFGAARMTSIYRTELSSRLRQEGESMSALGQDIRRLVNFAYPTYPPEAKEDLAVERFREALTDAAQRLSISQGKPTTLENAIHLALSTEAHQISERRREQRDRPIGHRVNAVTMETPVETKILEKLLDRMEQLERQVGDLSWKRSVECFNCGKRGHFARDCRAPRKEPLGNGGQPR